MSENVAVSIVIPILNEASVITASLPYFIRLQRFAQILFVDGGSRDAGPQLLKEAGFSVYNGCEAHRARQLNLGAGYAAGSQLVFLHVDTRLPEPLEQTFAQIESIPKWGYFAIRLDDSACLLRMVETGMNLRTRLTSVITGDHTLVVRPALFQQIGGFPDEPLMEDLAISRKLLRHAGRPKRLTTPVVTSARKWQREGILRTVLCMWTYRLAYFFGVSPKTLYAWYYQRKL